MSVKRIALNAVLGAGLLLAAYLLYSVFSRYSLDEIRQSIGQLSKARLLAAFGFCALSYLCLTGFDCLALRYIGKRLSYRRVALASFTALSIGHNLGVTALSSGAIRYRYYARWGLSTEEVAKLIVFCGVTVGLGLLTLAGGLVLLDPMDVSKILRPISFDPAWIGYVCLSIPAIYLICARTIRSPLRVWRWSFAMPDTKLALGQIIVGTLNFVCVAACLHQVITSGVEGNFLQSATAFVLANIAILITHVPGGLGVLEATVSAVLPGAASVGGLIAFRVIYFLIPLLGGLMTLALNEIVHGKHRKQQLRKRAKDPSEPQTQLL